MPDINLSSAAFDEADYVALRAKLISQSEKFPDFKVCGKYVYHRKELYTGDKEKEDAHDSPTSAHGGVAKTTERVRRYFFLARIASFCASVCFHLQCV